MNNELILERYWLQEEEEIDRSLKGLGRRVVKSVKGGLNSFENEMRIGGLMDKMGKRLTKAKAAGSTNKQLVKKFGNRDLRLKSLYSQAAAGPARLAQTGGLVSDQVGKSLIFGGNVPASVGAAIGGLVQSGIQSTYYATEPLRVRNLKKAYGAERVTKKLKELKTHRTKQAKNFKMNTSLPKPTPAQMKASYKENVEAMFKPHDYSAGSPIGTVRKNRHADQAYGKGTFLNKVRKTLPF